jgi:hypothetical protein
MNEMQLLRRADPARTAPLDEVLSEQALQERLAGAQSSTEEAYPAAALGAPPARYRRRRRTTVSVLATSAAVAVVFGALLPGLQGSRDLLPGLNVSPRLPALPKGSVVTPWEPGRPASVAAGAQRQNAKPGRLSLVSYVGPGWATTQGPRGGALDCPSVSACYMTGESAPDKTADVGPSYLDAVYFSADAGASWSSLKLPAGFEFSVGLSLTCGTTKDCAGAGVLGTKPALVSTNDGGHSWTVVPLALPGPLRSLSCAPGPVCYATIDLLPSATKGRFIPVQEFVRTTNGGRSWSVYALPGAIEVLTMACPSSRECIGAGVLRSTALTVQAVAFTVSTDGGRTWAVGRLSSPYSQGWPQNFSCASAKDCMAVSESAITSFPDQAPRCPAHFTRSAMSFSSPGPGEDPVTSYQCSGMVTGKVFTTTDGGKDWQVLPLHDQKWGGYSLQGLPGGGGSGFGPTLSCSSADGCWLVSPFFVVATTNGGRSWSAQHLPGNRSIGSISCPEVDGCIALGLTPARGYSVAVYNNISSHQG